MARNQNQSLERRQAILSFIKDYWEQHRISPTMREIQSGTHISSLSVISYHLNALEMAGALTRDDYCSRSIVVTPPRGIRQAESVAVPVVGVIVASAPAPTPDADALASADKWVQVDRSLVGKTDDLYALEVKGNSMIDALINHGDIVIMRKVQEVRNGDLAAVFLTEREETTLKRVYLEGERMMLKPENPLMEPFYVDASMAQIHGRVVCCLRQTEAGTGL